MKNAVLKSQSNLPEALRFQLLEIEFKLQKLEERLAGDAALSRPESLSLGLAAPQAIGHSLP